MDATPTPAVNETDLATILSTYLATLARQLVGVGDRLDDAR